MKKFSSPNFNERAEGTAITYVVLHYTGMKTASDALAHLCDPAAKVSAHYMIDEDGSLYQLIDETHRAWHAGLSFWRGAVDLNSLSLGIELVNKGHEFGYTPFPAPQVESLKTLLHDMMKRYTLPPAALLAHSDIAPERKEDPGELFPWHELAKEGLGLWPIPNDCDKEPITEAEITRLLGEMGYDIRTSQAAAASRIAFLRRFHPEQLSLGINDESAARLQALARLVICP